MSFGIDAVRPPKTASKRKRSPKTVQNHGNIDHTDHQDHHAFAGMAFTMHVTNPRDGSNRDRTMSELTTALIIQVGEKTAKKRVRAFFG
jgi:hypothetical protein